MSRTRIAVLECDHSLDPDRSLFGGYGGLVANWLQTNEQIKENSEISIWNVELKQEYPRRGEFDAVVITGSPTSPESKEPWVLRLLSFLREILYDPQSSVKIVGLCFGHQLLGAALGAEVRHMGYTETSRTAIELNPQLQRLFGKQQLILNEMHNSEVVGCPGESILLGSTTLCKNQGLYLDGKLLSVQAHPEFDSTTMRRVLEISRASGAIDEEQFQDGMLRNVEDTDGPIFLQAVAHLLLPTVMRSSP